MTNRVGEPGWKNISSYSEWWFFREKQKEIRFLQFGAKILFWSHKLPEILAKSSSDHILLFLKNVPLDNGNRMT